ncbi:MAG: hypothetical protein Q9169_004142 [Polycauliona sp. 2 TL-2023]
MGIKGIYKEIGPGERIALSKLAVEHFEKHGRSMRIAIDASIWHFQTQSGKGGSNPALRTLYYRLLRLLSLSIRPLFVFDGPNKPPFKRNAKTGTQAAALPNFITKQLLQLFGFPYHTAPGEAEAECALLQREEIVDAVLSEDVDTMMFGCTVHLRNWSSENVRGNKSPTHVNMYRAETTKQGKSGLDSDGMILIALMSGGDYIPAGIPGCGIKTACEAAKAGFGRDLCKLAKNDAVGFNQWRERLEYELRVNESGFFRARHRTLAAAIPEKFPDKTVLRYYTNPAVSKPDQVIRLRNEIQWDGIVDVPGLRRFVAEAFEWINVSGARKFVRGLAPAMLVDRLCRRYNMNHAHGDWKAQETQEAGIVTTICSRRNHFITDAVPELRIAYTPAEIVHLDWETETPDNDFGNVGDSENEVQEVDDERSRSQSPIKRGASTYDPTAPEKLWVLESYVKFGVPLMVENWEEAMRDPKQIVTRKARERVALSKKRNPPGAMKPGAMDVFVKTMKPGIDRRKPAKELDLPLGVLVPSLAADSIPASAKSPRKGVSKKAQALERPIPLTPKKPSLARVSRSSPRRSSSSFDNHVNPWTLSKRPPETLNTKLPRGTRFSALGIYGSSAPSTPSSSNKPGASDMDNSIQLLTPTSSGSRERHIDDPIQQEVSTLTPSKRVNRKLDFTAEAIPATHSLPGTPESLPSPSMLVSAYQPNLAEGDQHNGAMQQPPGKPAIQKIKRTRELLALRESLEGTWRDVKPWEIERGYVKRVYNSVELDYGNPTGKPNQYILFPLCDVPPLISGALHRIKSETQDEEEMANQPDPKYPTFTALYAHILTLPAPLLPPGKSTSASLTFSISALSLHPTLEVALHILNNDLPSAHFLVRHMQSPPAYEGMFLHGILHRIEGDYDNARAWYDNVCESDIFKSTWPEGKQAALNFIAKIEGLKKNGEGDKEGLEKQSIEEIKKVMEFCKNKFGDQRMEDASAAWVKPDERNRKMAEDMVSGGEGFRDF